MRNDAARFITRPGGQVIPISPPKGETVSAPAEATADLRSRAQDMAIAAVDNKGEQLQSDSMFLGTVDEMAYDLAGEGKWEGMTEDEQEQLWNIAGTALEEAMEGEGTIALEEWEKVNKQVATTAVPPLELRGQDLEGGRPTQRKRPARTPKRPKQCYCPVCGAIAEQTHGTPCTERECPKCGATMTGEYCAPSQPTTKEVGGTVATEYVMLKSADVDTIQFDEDNVQMVIKEGAQGVTFELDSDDPVAVVDLVKQAYGQAAPVAPAAASAALLKGGQAPAAAPAATVPAADPASPPAEQGMNFSTEESADLLQKVGDLTEKVDAMGKEPAPRPAAILTEPGLQKNITADTAEQITDEQQLLFNRIAGKEGTSLEEATAIAKSWADTGEVNTDPMKRQLSRTLVDVRLSKTV